MPIWNVTLKEIWHQEVLVEAETAEEAGQKALSGDDYTLLLEDNMEYSDTLEELGCVREATESETKMWDETDEENESFPN